MPSCLCFQSSYPYRATVRQHRTWDVSLRLRSWTISHVCLWPWIHNREWPQTPGADQPEKPCWHPSSTSTDAAQAAELWCHYQVPTWKGDASCWCPVKVLTTDWSRSSTWHSHSPCPHHPREETGVPEDNPRWPTPAHPCWHNSGRMAWGYQGHTQSTTPLPQPSRCHDCRRWTNSQGRSSHHSTFGKGENTTRHTRRTHGNHQVPVPCKTMCILAWNQWRYQENGWSMPNMSTPSPTGTKTATPTNPSTRTPMATHRCWLLHIRWIWVLSHRRLLHQNAIHQEDTTITV